MSHLKKIEAATGKLQKLLDWAKQNTMLAGIVITVLPAIASGGYITITKANEIIGMYNEFSDVASNASAAKRKVEALEEKVSEMRETIAKLQERSSDATINAREAKIMAESTQKELRSGLAAQKTELDVTSSTLRSEMNTLKRATTNRLGQ
jgi:chromosome segregation ATPase